MEPCLPRESLSYILLQRITHTGHVQAFHQIHCKIDIDYVQHSLGYAGGILVHNDLKIILLTSQFLFF